jgi:hypothetical protein
VIKILFCAVSAVSALSLAMGCRPPAPAARDRPDLRQVSLPDLARLAEPVRVQLRDRYASLMQIVGDRKASSMAYRGLRQPERAEAHMRLRTRGDIRPQRRIGAVRRSAAALRISRRRTTAWAS